MAEADDPGGGGMNLLLSAAPSVPQILVSSALFGATLISADYCLSFPPLTALWAALFWPLAFYFWNIVRILWTTK